MMPASRRAIQVLAQLSLLALREMGAMVATENQTEKLTLSSTELVSRMPLNPSPSAVDIALHTQEKNSVSVCFSSDSRLSQA
jgi:hypothetical protein